MGWVVLSVYVVHVDVSYSYVVGDCSVVATGHGRYSLSCMLVFVSCVHRRQWGG